MSAAVAAGAREWRRVHAAVPMRIDAMDDGAGSVSMHDALRHGGVRQPVDEAVDERPVASPAVAWETV